jgi:thioredoxin reductase
MFDRCKPREAIAKYVGYEYIQHNPHLPGVLMPDRPDSVDRFDAVVVGGGPAGLSAALLLGRSRRRVLVATDGPPRNAVAEAAHNVFTRDGTPPAELLRIGRDQLSAYDVSFREERVAGAERTKEGFRVLFEGGDRSEARKLLFASGVRDVLPPLDGLLDLWGRGAFHCPYCHGWEIADEPLALYARGEEGFDFARKLLGWSRDLVMFTDGPAGLSGEQRDRLTELNVEVREGEIVRLIVDSDGHLEAVLLAGGEVVSRHALFLHPSTELRSDLPLRLGCTLTEEGRVEADESGKTTVAGVYVAGDLAGNPEMVIVAAASGSRAAAALNSDLLEEDFGA